MINKSFTHDNYKKIYISIIYNNTYIYNISQVYQNYNLLCRILTFFSMHVEVLANKKITIIIDNCYLYWWGIVLSNFPPSLGVKEGYPVKERDNAMNEDIFLQVIIILVIIIYGNQKKDANK